MLHLRRCDKDIDIISIDKGAFNFRVNGLNRKTQDVAECKKMPHGWICARLDGIDNSCLKALSLMFSILFSLCFGR